MEPRRRVDGFHRGLGGREAHKQRAASDTSRAALRRRRAVQQKRRLAAIPVHTAPGTAAPGPAPVLLAPSGTITTPAGLTAALRAAAVEGTPGPDRLAAFGALREAATSERVPPRAWLEAGVPAALAAVLGAPTKGDGAEAAAAHRHAAAWLVVELTASDAEGTVELATALAAEAGPLLVPFLDGPDTVMAEMTAHALANVMASSPALPAALGRLGAAAALGRQLRRLPSSLAGRAMWAARQFLHRPEISHGPVLEAALPAVSFWLAKAGRGAADADGAPAPGGAAAGEPSSPPPAGGAAAAPGLRSAVIEAALLLAAVGSAAHEAWPALLDPATSPLPAACAAVVRPALHPAVRARLLEAIACASWAVDAGGLLLAQAGFGDALVALAAAGAPEVDASGRPTGRGLTGGALEARAMSPRSDISEMESLGATPTSTAHFALTIAANSASGTDPDVPGAIEARRRALAASGASAALPDPAALSPAAGPGEASPAARHASYAGAFVAAGLHAVCARWLHSSARMRLTAVRTLSALALAGAGPGAAPAHLADVVRVPGVLPALAAGVSVDRSIEEAGRCLGVLRAGFAHLGSAFAEAAEAAGARESLDELSYSRHAGTDGPWGHLAREAKRLVDTHLEDGGWMAAGGGAVGGAGDEDDDLEDEDEDGAGLVNPFAGGGAAASAGRGAGAAAGRGRGRGLLTPAWMSGAVPGASAGGAKA